MRTAVVVAEQVLSRVPGGTGRYVRNLLENLPATAPSGWLTRSVVARHADTSAALVAGVSGPRRLPVDPRVLNRLWQRGLPPWVRGDVVHAPTPLVPPRLPRSSDRLVVTVHDAVPFTHPQTLTPHGARWHQDMVRRAERFADAVIVPTAAVAQELSEFVTLGDRVQVVPMGATALPAPTDAADRRTRLGLPERYLMTLATVEPRKGLDVLIEALGRADLTGIPLVVVGQAGWGGVDPAALAAAAGLSPDRLILAGRLSDTDLGAVLHGAAALVMPSRAEGFGLPVVEAMLAGVPVVHSAVPALVEVAGGASVVSAVGDSAALAQAIGQVWHDPDLAADLVARGRVRGGEFTWTDTAEQTWKVYTG